MKAVAAIGILMVLSSTAGGAGGRSSPATGGCCVAPDFNDECIHLFLSVDSRCLGICVDRQWTLLDRRCSMADFQAIAAEARRCGDESQAKREAYAKGECTRTEIIDSFERALRAAQNYIIAAPDGDPGLPAWVNFATEIERWLQARDKENIAMAAGTKGKKGSPTKERPVREAEFDPNEWEKGVARNKDGQPLSTPTNAHIYLRYHEDFRNHLRWNTFSKQVELVGGPMMKRVGSNADFDVLLTACEDWLHTKFGIKIRYADLKRRVSVLALNNPYNPLANYLESHSWDGKERIADFLIRRLGAKTTASDDTTDITEHLLRISQRWFVSAIARALDPGCQMDTVLVLEGLQGLRKTTVWRVLGGEFGCETELAIGDKDSKQLAATRWIIELAELDSIRKRKTSTVNAFLSSKQDFYRPPYKGAHESSPRMCVFVGTTNHEEWIADSTGDRRYWPVRVTKIDIPAIEEDRDQLWAEAVAVFKAGGRDQCAECAQSYRDKGEARCPTHRWWLDAGEQKVANQQTAERLEPSAWEEHILKWWLRLGEALSTRSVDPTCFSIADVAEYALKLPVDQWDRYRSQIGRCLNALGFIKFKRRPGGGGNPLPRYKPDAPLLKMKAESKS